MQLKTTMTHVGQWWPNATDDRRQAQAPDARNSMLITSFRSRESQDQDADCRPGDISSASRLKLGGGDGASAISNLKSRHPPRCLPAYPRSAARIGSGRLSAPYPPSRPSCPSHLELFCFKPSLYGIFMLTMLTNTSTCIDCTRFRDTLPSTSSWRSCLSARPADIHRHDSESEQQSTPNCHCLHEKGKHQSIAGGRSSIRLARCHGCQTHTVRRLAARAVRKCQRFPSSFRCLHSTSRAPAWHDSFAALCPALTDWRTVEQCPPTHLILPSSMPGTDGLRATRWNPSPQPPQALFRRRPDAAATDE